MGFSVRLSLINISEQNIIRKIIVIIALNKKKNRYISVKSEYKYLV